MHALTNFVDSLEVPGLTKSALVDMLIEQMGLNGREAVELVEGFFELILDRLSKGEDVKLAGFGNFEVHHKKERPGRNPRTGEGVQISPRRVVKFSAGPKFMQRMANKQLAAELSIPKVGSELLHPEVKQSRRASTRSEEARQPAGL
ncbi:integration host factor subunit alpha [Hydrogenophaga sp.]|uniref:integration host factor subunit alpha n=1 Tax=Hydrogenophaga sp. TaxID=1904254 RepID=UPI003AF91AF6